jgi:hypothetical protein
MVENRMPDFLPMMRFRDPGMSAGASGSATLVSGSWIFSFCRFLYAQLQ